MTKAIHRKLQGGPSKKDLPKYVYQSLFLGSLTVRLISGRHAALLFPVVSRATQFLQTCLNVPSMFLPTREGHDVCLQRLIVLLLGQKYRSPPDPKKLSRPFFNLNRLFWFFGLFKITSQTCPVKQGYIGHFQGYFSILALFQPLKVIP